MGVTWIKCVSGFSRGLSEKPYRVETYREPLRGMARAAASLAVKVDKRAEPFWFAADDRDHERKSQHAGSDERRRGPADTDPDGQRILKPSRVARFAFQWPRGAFQT